MTLSPKPSKKSDQINSIQNYKKNLPCGIFKKFTNLTRTALKTRASTLCSTDMFWVEIHFSRAQKT